MVADERSRYILLSTIQQADKRCPKAIQICRQINYLKYNVA